MTREEKRGNSSKLILSARLHIHLWADETKEDWDSTHSAIGFTLALTMQVSHQTRIMSPIRSLGFFRGLCKPKQSIPFLSQLDFHICIYIFIYMCLSTCCINYTWSKILFDIPERAFPEPLAVAERQKEKQWLYECNK